MIEVQLILRTEVDMIVNRINHHINHYYITTTTSSTTKVSFTYPQFSEFFYEEELRSPIYHYNDFGENHEDGGSTMEDNRGSLILNLIGKADLRTLIGKIGFLILSMT